MEEKGKLGARNWDFLDHTNNSDSELDPPLGIPIPQPNVSEYQGAFLKMNAYGPDLESSSMEFSWVPPRNFLSPTQDEETKHQVNGTSNHITSKQKASTKKKSDRIATKTIRPKAPKKKKATSGSIGRQEKKSQEDPCDGSILDLTTVPSPMCTCTGVPRQCYRWGAGGWQSSCCTTSVSEYPLPMSSSRPGSRLAGRKMSIGAYSKLLKRLANEGYDLSFAVDLKDHWSRHGTNKFVTIK